MDNIEKKYSGKMQSRNKNIKNNTENAECFINSENYIYKNQKKLRYGYTTGSCAAAASKAAAIMLLSGKKIKNIKLLTPKGIELKISVKDINIEQTFVKCAVQKDSGDDPDVTDKILIYAEVYKNSENEFKIEGGEGVGRVTKPGLDCAVGEAAINRVPRKMITEALKNVCDIYDYKGGLTAVISVPEGREKAKKTFNPRLGIEGGISIIGTSGIIEPMSEKALIDTIRIEMKQQAAEGRKYFLVSPGNYGVDFSKDKIKINTEKSVKCSNYIGETLDAGAEVNAEGMLFIAHIGKFIKVAGGIMNTHSKNADSRMEILTAHAALYGASVKTVQEIMECCTTDEALDILENAGLKEKVMDSVMQKIDFYLKNRAGGNFETGCIMFSNKHGLLGKTKNADELLNKISREM